LNWELLVKPKVVVPANVTDVPGLSLLRIMAELAGAWMLERMMDAHAATAEEIWE
jgi:hypothetical protein